MTAAREARGFGKARPRVALFFIALICVSAPDEARSHLLNMSRVTVAFHAGGLVRVDMALDLLVTFGSREAYYEASLLERPLQDPTLGALLAPVAAAVELTVSGAPVPLQLRALEFAVEDREAYLDPLNWPRAQLRLEGRLAQPSIASSVAQVRYSESFRFEEPIANTFSEPASGRTQTRWLVTGQRSPVFRLGNQGASIADLEPALPADPQAVVVVVKLRHVVAITNSTLLTTPPLLPPNQPPQPTFLKPPPSPPPPFIDPYLSK